MQPLLKAGIFAGAPGQVEGNPGNVTRDMFTQPIVRPIPYGDGARPDEIVGLVPSKAPQQRVILRPGSRYTGAGSFNRPGDPSLIPPTQVLDSIGGLSGSTAPMGSQGGMDTSLGGARRRAGR